MEICSNPALALMTWCLITDVLPSPGMLFYYTFAFRKVYVCELKCLFIISATNVIYDAVADVLCQAPGKT
jgi:hypothetical protein